jgi:hypothetical protein
MKRQHHGMSTKTDDQWPIEDTREKIDIQHATDDHSELGKHIPSIARGKAGFASEHYHRAVAEMAYGFWEARGHPRGSPETDWFKAEAALKPLWSADLSFASGDSASNPGKL